MTKQELELAVKEGRVTVEHVLLQKNAKEIPSTNDLINMLLDGKEYICEDGKHYGENDIDLNLIFD